MSNQANTHASDRERTAQPRRGTLAIVDAMQAIVATERLCARALWAPDVALTIAVEQAFGETVELLGIDVDGAREAIAACEAVVAKGGRAAAVLSASSLSDARRELGGLADRRRPVVIHVIIAPKGRDATAANYADLHAVTDVGVGVLYARDAQDASDLVVVAHRAAEDAEAPILVVHDGYPASYARDRVVLPDAPLVRAALEPAPPPLSAATDSDLPGHRRAAGRVPFALASAMRAFERLSGLDRGAPGARRLDALEAIHTHDAELAILAAGSISETCRAVVEHLRRANPPVAIGLVQLTTLRPFPGPQIVKALSRVRAIAVVERVDEPLSQSNPLAVEVKAAFADALTWAPGYPGIGRIPNIYSGCVEPSSSEATPGEIVAIVENVFQGELGRRVFHVGASHPHAHALPPAAEREVHPEASFALRWRGDPALLVHLLCDMHGAHVRATPRPVGSEGVAAGAAPFVAAGAAPIEVYDVTVSPSPVRAHHGASALDVVVLGHGDGADLEALDELRDGGTALIAGSNPATAWKALSSAVRAGLRSHAARVLSVPASAANVAGAMMGALLQIRPPPGLDRAQIVAELERSLRTAKPSLADAEIHATVEVVTRAMQEAAELPRATVDSA